VEFELLAEKFIFKGILFNMWNLNFLQKNLSLKEFFLICGILTSCRKVYP
jgi:hypothetical protein